MVSRSGDEVEVREGFSICKIQKMIKLRETEIDNSINRVWIQISRRTDTVDFKIILGKT